MSIHEKLIQFQAKFKGAEKTGFNPHFKSAYYTTDDLRNAIKPILDEIGLYISHRPEPDGNGGFTLWTYITDKGGDSIKCGLPVPACNNPQVTGSWITYMERYNVMGLLFSGGELEDDGNIAAANAPEAITQETTALINDYIEANGLSDEQKNFFAKHPLDAMTEEMGRKVLNKMKAAA